MAANPRLTNKTVAPFQSSQQKEPERPKLGPLVPVIDAILEADKTAPPQQRHTAKRIFERLRIEGERRRGHGGDHRRSVLRAQHGWAQMLLPMYSG
jgi:hypothetical protein